MTAVSYDDMIDGSGSGQDWWSPEAGPLSLPALWPGLVHLWKSPNSPTCVYLLAPRRKESREVREGREEQEG